MVSVSSCSLSRAPSSSRDAIRSLVMSSPGCRRLVLDELGHRAAPAGQHGLGLLRGHRGVDHHVDDLGGLGPGLLRHADEVGDQAGRQRVGEPLPQVDDLAGLHRGERVEQLTGQFLDARPDRLRPPRGERLADEPAQPDVILAVGGDHVVHGDPADHLPVRRDLAVDERRPVVAGALRHPRIGQDALDDVMAVEGPGDDAARQLHLGRRALRAQGGGLGMNVAPRRVQGYRAAHLHLKSPIGSDSTDRNGQEPRLREQPEERPDVVGEQAGCSIAAKWPPRSNSVQCTMSCSPLGQRPHGSEDVVREHRDADRQVTATAAAGAAGARPRHAS